jgi:hypothetical protein
MNTQRLSPEKGFKIMAKQDPAAAKAAKQDPAAEEAKAPEAPQPPAVPLDPTPVKQGKLYCQFTVKEGGTTYPAGTEYTGKNAKHLLAKGAIKKV